MALDRVGHARDARLAARRARRVRRLAPGCAQWQRAKVSGAARPTLAAPEGRTGSYVVPYSFHRLDSFTGYAAGMPSPGYYQALWELGAGAAEHMLHLAARRLRERPALHRRPLAASEALAGCAVARAPR
jgi:hypothetical protein